MVILGNLGKIMTSKWNACHRQNWGRVVWGVAQGGRDGLYYDEIFNKNST